MVWKHLLETAAHRTALTAEEQFDNLKARLRERLGRRDPVLILPYRGFGTEDRLWLCGRVLEDNGLGEPEDRDTAWRNVLAMYRRFETDEVPGVRLRAQYGAASYETTTDEEGYFEIELRPQGRLPADRLWHEVALELLDEVVEGQGAVRATGEVLAPPPEATFGIISDIDDTVLQTNAASLLAMAQATFLQNARTRLPFEGVAAFYRALQRGPGDTAQNPLFFVSSSPWNLYDFLEDFLTIQGIPAGPILLRDLGIDATKFIKSGHDHKLDKIGHVMTTFPNLPFVLIGDSGQEDPEIYREAVQRYPGRIRAVYIRDVTTEARDAAVHAIAEEIGALGVEMLLVRDTEAAALHAADHGFIDPAELPNIRAEKAKDETAPDAVEQMLGGDAA